MFSLRYRRTSYAAHQQTTTSSGGNDIGTDNNSKSPFYCDEDYDAKSKKLSNVRPHYVMKALGSELTAVTALTLVALVFRLWSINVPRTVVSAELEICNQINWYMAEKFFIGAYPPLAGMFYATLARYFGYSGGEPIYYAGQFPLSELRVTSAAIGTLLVPIVYLTVRKLGHQQPAATTAAGLLIFENGLITQSRFLMPEGLLCLLCSLTALTWAIQLRKQEREPFMIPYNLQAITGVLMGCALSIKWQGVISLVVTWTSTLTYLWKILGEKKFGFNYVAKQFIARFITTAVLPLCIYLMLFHIHIGMIPMAGDHDLVVSPRLRFSLEGNEFPKTQQDIAYGSSVVLRHWGSNGGYLHSHFKRYEGGSTQQQVSVYPFEDMNNIWVIHKADNRWNASQPVEYVRNNDRIMLEHYSTVRKLHSHDHRPPVSNKKEQSEVSAYGDPLVRDPHDYWWIQVLYDDGQSDGDDKTPIKAVNTRIRLLHSRICHLLSHNVRLPDADKPQQEAICMQGAKKELSAWVIEQAYHENLEGEELVGYEKMTRMEIIKEVHRHMLSYRSVMHDHLAPTPPADPTFQIQLLKREQAKPMDWFFGTKAYRLWDQVAGRSVYLAMNPSAKVMTFIALATCGMYMALSTILQKRQIKLPRAFEWAASLIHALALYMMPAFNLKLADSLPSAYFSAGLIAVVLDAVTLRMSRKTQYYACLTVVLLACYGFIQLYPVSYGSRFWTQSDCRRLNGIDLECNRYPETNPHAQQQQQRVTEDEKRDKISIVYVDMPGKAEPFRYHIGHEIQADEHIAAMQGASFSKAYREATGTARYHRVESTPGPSETEVAMWQKEIFAHARERAEQEAIKVVEEANKKLEEEAAQKEHEEQGQQQEAEQQKADD
ncbi:hypothetical protein BDB00DRAFT_791129 [Zychaea mexicana]|uniref:uncharacterized protein n=1 Tax=Zychaea mexicana TaxID=64656 RepID=UPI0022FE7580|nr:uncharacterized protein BDB00DRAFT_791129 [Zychaea mexicana]KAI9489426.1 hypothetical protein BDB00DRAFT_791129 [Zychaea mexicana]